MWNARVRTGMLQHTTDGCTAVSCQKESSCHLFRCTVAPTPQCGSFVTTSNTEGRSGVSAQQTAARARAAYEFAAWGAGAGLRRGAYSFCLSES